MNIPVTVISGDSNTHVGLMYGMTDRLTADWCAQRTASIYESLSPEMRDLYRPAEDSIFNTINYDDMLRTQRGVERRFASFWQQDNIRALPTIEHQQTAPPVMIEWIMAHPILLQMHHEQKIAGYDEEFKPIYTPDQFEDNYHYRAAINGVFMETGNGEEMVAQEWLGEFDETDQALELSDQVSIIETWHATLANILKKSDGPKEDPTSRYNAIL